MKLKHFMLALVAMLSGFAFTANAQTEGTNYDVEEAALFGDDEYFVNCDYTSSTSGWGTTKFSNYDAAFAKAKSATLAKYRSATIIIEKTNTLSGNCLADEHDGYTMLAVVVKDGATIGVAISKWDMTYPVTVEPGGAIVSARGKSSGYINSHIKNTLTIGSNGAGKKAVLDFLGGSYQSGSVSIMYNGKIVANNATIEVGDFGFSGTGTFNNCDITVGGVLATGKNNNYKQTMANTTVTVGGTNYQNENTYYSTEGTLLHNLTLDNSTIAIGNGDGVVVKTVTLKNGSAWTVAEGASVNTTNAKVTVYGSVEVPEELANNSTANELVSNTAVSGYTPTLPAGVTNLTVELTNIEATSEETTKVTFNVEPKNASGNKVSETSEITFRLPVPSAWAGKEVVVYHDGEAMPGTYTVQSGNYIEVKSTEFSEFAVELFEPVAKIGDAGYASLAAAVAAAQVGDEIVVIADVADVTVDVTKNLTISGSVTLNNVGINASGADALTVKGLTFTGNSWINSGTAEALTVSGVTATVAPNNATYTNSRSAFISLGRSEQQTLALTVENCNITVTSSGPDAILGWAAITKATITGNVIKGSSNGYFTNADAIKFMAIADGAEFEIKNNEIWSNYNGIVFGQNTTRANAYSVYADANKFVGGADHIWIEVSGANTVHATVNATSANTVNGNAFTINDIKYHSGVINTWSSYAGVDVETNENGKVIGGTLASYSNEECIAEGYEMGETGVVAEKAAVAIINGVKYATLAEALAAAKAMTGDVTVEIYEKVTLNGALTGNYASIKFVGQAEAAEIYLDIQGYSEAAGKKVAFENLKLSKVAGEYITNAGFMNLAFGIYGATETTYTNCTFVNGAYASTGKVTFTGCTFYRSHDRYGLWAYGDVDAIVDGCTFADIRGIKMYAEGQGAEGSAVLTVKNTDFTAADNKPAIVLTYGESVTLAGNTYSSTGTFELDLDGKPNGVAVTSDVAPVCVNDNGACGVLVDGKIYTTVAQAAEVATETSTVTLLHSSNETVEFPMGTTIEKNGFTADNVTTAQPFAEYVVLPISMTVNNYKALFGTNTVTDGTNYYATLQAAVEAVAGQVNAVLYCKPGADVGSLQHAPVVSTLTIYGNGANVTGGAERDFDLGNTDPSAGKDITADMTLTVKHLNGCGAWGAKATNHTVNLVFENCANMGKVFITGTTGTLNITMTDCAFEGVIKEAVYSNADGAITLNNVAFSNLNKAINLNHKAAGTQTVTINGCSFTNCGADVAADQIPVRVLSSVDGGKTVLNVSNTTFTGTPANGADILLDYAVGLTEATVAGTTANVVVEKENNVGTKTEVSTDNNYEFTTAKPVAKIGDVEYATLEEAVASAQAGATITLLSDATISANLTLPAGITFNGNGKQITGAEVWAAGNLTFVGHTKVQMFNAGYNKPVITIGEGACLELTSTGRMVIGHGATFNITGNISDAKTANVADLTPSLIMAGASFTGAGVTFNVTNAYIKATAYCSSKNSNASGTFNFNITNSIWEQTGSFVFTEPTNGKDPIFNLNFKDGVLNSTSHLVFAVTKGEIIFDNSNVNGESARRQIENRSTMTIKNGAVVYGAVATSSNAKNPGTLTVDNATYNVTGEFSGSDLGTGKLVIKKDANVSVGSITKANIVIDATDMTAGELANFTANLSQFTGTLSVINNDKLEAKIVDGKVVLAAKPVAKIGEVEYATLAAAVAAAQADDEIVLLNDVVLDETVTIAKSVTINGNGHKVTPANAETTYNSAFMVGDSGWGDDHGETITLNNIVFEGWNTNYGVVRAQGVTLAMDGCEFNGNSVSNAAYAVLSLNYTDATVKDSKFVGNNERAIDVNYNADGSEAVVTIDACTFDGNTTTGAGIIYKNAGDVKVKNSTFVNNTVSTNGNAATVYTGWGDGDEVSNCTFKNNIVTTSHATTKRFASAIFCDGCVVSENVFGEGNTATRNGESISTIVAVGAYYGVANISANYWGAAPEKGIQYTIEYTRNEVALNSYYKDAAKTDLYTFPVAKIGDVEYTLLQDAIDAVKEGETITLVDDVNVTTPAYGQNALNHAKAVSFTLDLNGKTLSADTGNSVFRFNIANSGATSDVTLTIKNGTIIAGSNTWCAVMASGISADVKAIMNLEDLTIEASKAGDLAVKSWSNATINAKNVTVNATNAAGGFYAVGGEIVLDNCTVNQKGLHTAPYLSMAFAVSSNGKMTINSGTYSAEPTAAAEGSNQGSTHGSWVGGVMNSGGELIINGGTFSNGNFGDDALATAARGLIFADTDGEVTVNGGTFNALKSIFDFQNNLGGTSPVITVMGGNYSADPRTVTSYGSIVLDANCVVVENDGVWNVVKAAAKIDEQGYATIKDAVAAVKESETITILAGTHSEGTIKLPATLKNVTIKGAEGAELKDMTISAADGNAYSYEGLTFDGITFDNSRILLTGWRNGDETIKDFTVTKCTFKNLDDNTNSAPVHINKDAAEAVNGFTFTNNVIDGATGGSKSGVYAQVTGNVVVSGNVINNVSFRPYVIQVTTDDGVADNFTVTGNTFSGSAAGRAQGLGNNAEGTDNVNLVVSNNIFKGITDAQQICYWDFNAAKTTADLSKNYYDIDIVANPSRIYYNGAAANTADLTSMGVFPIYTELNEDGTINTASAYYPPVVMMGENGYQSVKDALAAAKAENLTEVVITIVGENTADTKDDFGLYEETAFNNVTIKQDNGGKAYYFDCIYTGKRAVADGQFVFDGVNIVIAGQYINQCKTVLKNNSKVERSADAKNFIMGEMIVEAGSKYYSQIDAIYAGSLTIDGGQTDGYNTEADYKTVFFDTYFPFVIKNGAYVLINAANENGSVNLIGGTTSIEASKLDVFQSITINANATLALDIKSIVTTKNITGAGKINVDATGIEGTVTVIEANMSGFTGTINVEGGKYEITSQGLVIKEQALTGIGTAEDPFLINNVEELVFFRDKVNSGDTKYNAPGVWVALAADIDLAGTTWTEGIGDGHNWSFDGNFDGQGHTIKNLTVAPYADANKYLCGGLFGYIYGGATIKNLVIENATVEFVGEAGKEYFNVGVLVGFANNNGGKANISNITVKGDIKVNAPNAYGVGAIVGYSYREMGTIANCTVEANAGSYIKGHSFVGGITGYSYTGATIAGCSVKNLAITATKYSVGGIAGITGANNTVSNCVVENVTVNGEANVGNVVGAISADALVVENCTAAEPLVGGNYSDNKPVEARIGNKYYATLTAALVAEGNEVELLVPVTVAKGETRVIDLNGKTVTGVDNATGSYAMITNQGDLTITGNGKITLTATIDRDWNAYSSVISNTVGGKLTVENGTIEHLGGTDMAYAIDNLTNGKGTYAETEINGGTIKSTYRAIRQFLNGVEAQNILTVNGGTIEGANKSIWFQDPSANANSGTLTVTEDATLKGDVYLTVTAGSTKWPVEVAIADAAFAEGKTVVTGNVPTNYKVVLYDGVHSVECTVIDELHIVDGLLDEFVNRSNKTVGTLTYKRTFPTFWNPFYVPFEVPVSQLVAQGFEVAYINGVRRDDTDYDGELDEFVMEVIYIHGGNADGAGKTLKANYPYFIKAKNGVTTMEIELENVTLYKAEDKSFDCTTMTEKFELIGNNSTKHSSEFQKNMYIVASPDNKTAGWGAIKSGSSLKPFRFYMNVTSREDSDVVIPMEYMSISVRGEMRPDGTTFIYDVEMDAEQAVDYIYDLQGRRVLEPQKGNLYIINGKKVIF